jgi:uncharacterized protein YceK
VKNYVIVMFLSNMFFLSGCGTYASLEHSSINSPIVLGGTRTDIAQAVGETNNNEWLSKQRLYNPVLDLPFSLISDLVLMPFTIPLALVIKFR